MSRLQVLTYLLNSAWQVPLLASAAWLAVRLASPAPRMRYAVWVATLLLSVVLPLRSLAGLTIRPAAHGTAVVAPVPVAPVPAASGTPPSVPWVLVLPKRAAWLVAACYTGTIVLALCRLLWGGVAVHRLLRACGPRVLTASERGILESAAGRFGIAAPAVRTHPAEDSVPMVTGLLHPVLLLPRKLESCPKEEFHAVAAHELAHLARHDLRVNAMLRLLAAPVAYHPATAYVKRQIARSRELAADALAATLLPEPAVYARTLLGLANRLLSSAQTSGMTAGLFGLADITRLQLLEERIMTLITPHAATRPLLRAGRLAASLAVFTVAAGMGASLRLLPPVFAQEKAQMQNQAGTSEVETAAQTPAPPSPALAPPPAPAATPQPAAPAEPAARSRKHDSIVLSIPASDSQKQSSSQALSDGRKTPRTILVTVPDTAELERQGKLAADAVDTPEFRLTMQKLAEQSAALTIEMSKLKQEMAVLDPQVFNLKLPALARLDSPEFKAQVEAMQKALIKARTDLPGTPMTLHLITPERQAALDRQLAAASASLDKAIQKTVDAEVAAQLEQVKAALEKARQLH